MDLAPVPLSASGIALLEAVSVANIDSPTELNAIAGVTVGERRVCYQAIANDNVYTVYYFDASDGSGASSPYVLAASGSGFWIAGGGKYTNSAVSLRSTLAVTGTSTMAAINASGNIACTSTTVSLTNSAAGGTTITAKNNDTTSTTTVEFDLIGTTTGGASRNAARLFYSPNTASSAVFLLQTGKVSGILWEGATTVLNQREGGPIILGINDTEVGRWTSTGLNAAAIGATTASTGKFTSVTDSGLTSGRVTFASTGGLLADSANLTWDGAALVATAGDATIGFRVAGATGRMRVRGYVDSTNGTVVEATSTSEAAYQPLSFGASIYRFFAGAIAVFNDTTDSTGVGNGSLVTLGGLSASKSAFIGGNVTITNASLPTLTINNTTTASSSWTLQHLANGNLQLAQPSQNTWLTFTHATGKITSIGPVLISDGTASTSNVTGALVVTGGIASSANSYFSGPTINFTSGTASSSTTTGNLVVSGGIGVGGAANIGGALVATSATASSQLFFSDASTNIAPSVFQYGHKTSGTPAASFGAEVDCLLHSSTNVSRAAFATVTTWVVPTDASRTARTQFYALDTGFRECIRIEASGSAPMVGLYGTDAAIQYATTGTSTGFTAGAGTTATSLSTFTGNTGSTAYTVGDIVRALKLIGVMAA